MENDKEKIDEEINENHETQDVDDSKEDNIDQTNSENNEQEIIGAIGVVGPTRLNYSKIVPLVDYTSKIIGKVVK